ncbi:MAG: hypothetical protein ABSF82_03375 [Candidatus Bathyarchaeia archaeon]
MELNLQHPRLFAKAKEDHLDSQSLLKRVLVIAIPPKTETKWGQKILCLFMSFQYAVEAVIVAHLEMRKAWQKSLSRKHFWEIVDDYRRRLLDLFGEVGFDRSDVHFFIKGDEVVWPVNVSEVEALDYVDANLQAGLWAKLNDVFGLFTVQAYEAAEIVRNKGALFKALFDGIPTRFFASRRSVKKSTSVRTEERNKLPKIGLVLGRITTTSYVKDVPSSWSVPFTFRNHDKDVLGRVSKSKISVVVRPYVSGIIPERHGFGPGELDDFLIPPGRTVVGVANIGIQPLFARNNWEDEYSQAFNTGDLKIKLQISYVISDEFGRIKKARERRLRVS